MNSVLLYICLDRFVVCLSNFFLSLSLSLSLPPLSPTCAVLCRHPSESEEYAVEGKADVVFSSFPPSVLKWRPLCGRAAGGCACVALPCPSRQGQWHCQFGLRFGRLFGSLHFCFFQKAKKNPNIIFLSLSLSHLFGFWFCKVPSSPPYSILIVRDSIEMVTTVGQACVRSMNS